MNREELRAELLRRRENNKKIIKRACTVILAALILVLEIYGVIWLVENSFFVSEKSTDPLGQILYPNADYDRDIMKDSAYLEILERSPLISLRNEATGEEETLFPEEYDKHGKAVSLLCRMVLAIQAGDADTYNACFSDAYLIAEGKKYASEDSDPSLYEDFTDAEYKNLGIEESFTMQQIYDVVITRVSEVENPQTHKITYTYKLKYKIRQNNGTLRPDMGSDCYREQKLVLVENAQTGNAEIYSVVTESNASVYKIVHVWRIVLICAAALVITALTVLFAIFMFRRSARTALSSTHMDGATSETKENEVTE